MFIYNVVSVNRNIVRYNKCLVVVTVVVVFVSSNQNQIKTYLLRKHQILL